jgi:serine/threonine-protein kinase
MGFAPGDRVDRYEILELLGSGGMGEVYRARDRKLERLVALKVVRVDKGLGTDGAARLLREARAAAALSHPNVLAIYDVGEVQEPEALRGLAYIAMELVVGKSLRAYIGDESVSMEQRISWMKDVARALGAAHEAGIVHRDVKPENVMVRFDGVVKVLDFGIARRAAGIDAWSSTEGHILPTHKGGPPAGGAALATLTQSDAVVGTPLYMAPEQLKREPLDGRADQFAWGVVTYELLTGALPWIRTTDALAVAAEILTKTPRRVAESVGDVPDVVSDTIARTLGKEPAERFASMGDLLAGLEPRQLPKNNVPKRSGGDRSNEEPRAGGVRWVLTVTGMFALVTAVSLGIVKSRRATQSREAGNLRASAKPAVSETCVSNAECVTSHGGKPWKCHSARRECVALESEDCKVQASALDLKAPDTVWIGAMYPATTEPSFADEIRGADLARQEFAGTLGPAASRADAMHARPIGLVVCDESADALRAARHLTDDVESPAVIGFREGGRAIDVIGNVFIPKGVVSMITINQGTPLTKIPAPEGPRLVWRTTVSFAEEQEADAALISGILEPMIRSLPGGIGREPMRAAIIATARQDVANDAHWARGIRFNGKGALENGDNFRQFVSDADAGVDELVDALLTYRPQLVYVLVSMKKFVAMLPMLDARWGRSAKPLYFIGAHFNRGILEYIGTNRERRRRFFAVTNASSRTNEELVLQYNRAYPNEVPATPANCPQPSYDAFYMLAYGIYALGADAFTGSSLSRAMERLLPPGQPMDVGASNIFEVFQRLRQGGRVDLNGALGPLDFDLGKGEAPIDYALLCCGVDERGEATGSVASGVIYDAHERRIRGQMACP